MKSKDEEEARNMIDKKLKKSNWSETEDDQNGTGYFTEYHTETGPVDYALLINGDPISIIEAKKPSRPIDSFFDQAERYARSITDNTEYSVTVGRENYKVPIVFCSNGNQIKLIDLRLNSPNSRIVPRFPTKQNLQKLASINYESAFSKIKKGLVNDIDPKLWDHQQEAADAVFDAWMDSEQKALTHLATGTGKTRMAMAISWAFLESGLGQKILFIPNQRPLADDAYESFRGYNPQGRDLRMGERYRVENLLDDEDAYKNADIVTTTLQKVYTMAKEDNPFSLNEFDLIISDESHRSIYNEEDGYGYALDQLDAYHLGLTATPTERTIEWFGGNNVYQYTYNDGVEDGNLVPFTVEKVETKLSMSGIEKDGKQYSSQDIGSKIQIPDTNITVGNYIRDHIENTLNKNINDELILIFACNDRHAIEIVEDLRQDVFNDKADSFIKRATYSADRPHDHINYFSQPYKNPNVLVTVQMVEEGVDIPDLEHIVLMKPVRSPVTYNQMMGRGTRASGGKDSFTIYDCLGAVEYFDQKGYGPFNTLEFEGATQQTGSSGTPKEKQETDYIVVDKEDDLYRTQTIFQLESGKEITQQEFREKIENFVKNNRNTITELRMESNHLNDFNNKLTKLFLTEDKSFRVSLLAKAFGLDEKQTSYVDITDYIQYGVNLNSKRTQKVISLLSPEIKDTSEGKYFKKLLEDSINKNRLSKDDFFREPLSEIGYTTIEENLSMTIEEFIEKYNLMHLTIGKRKV